MAAYAALVSLMNIMDEIQLHHPRHLISLDRVQIETLRECVTFLIDFLEGCSERGSKEAVQLESSITKAAYAARFIIELDVTENISQFYVGDRIRVPSRSHVQMNSILYQGVKRVILEIVSIRVRAEIFKNAVKSSKDLVDLNVFEFKSSMPSYPMVGSEECLIRILDGLTNPQQPNRQIIPITGMGGIGKTTLAKNVYDHPTVVEHFDIRAWVIVSQECSVRKILLGVLYYLRKEEVGESLDAFIGKMSQTGEGQLGEQLHKILFGRRYLLIMDDMWSVDIWNKTKNYFPDNSNGSRVIVTTRLSNLANDFGACGIEMNFLDEDKSWKLLCEKVFDKERCPLELEETGKKIANKCNGLPLSLVVTGGLLAKSTKTLEYWEAVASDVNAIVNSQDDCLKILSLSYNHLPVHLKPCFLYMGVLRVTRVSELTKSWVAEGFIKPVRTKSLEEVANEYLKDLIDRNLIMVHEWGSSGKMKTCNMHDLLRDLSLRNAEKEKFISVARACLLYTDENIESPSCRVISQSTSDETYWGRVALGSFGSPSPAQYVKLISKSIPPSAFGYMTVLKDTLGKYFYELQEEEKYYLRLVCSRYFEFTVGSGSNFKFPSSLHLLWNLQTLVIENQGTVIAPVEIWELKQLRHVKSRSVVLPDPPPSGGGRFNVMENLQSLARVENFKCNEEVLKRIPNIQNLKVEYTDSSTEYENEALHCLNNFGRLEKLKSLYCSFYPPSWIRTLTGLPIMWQSWRQLWQNLTFPSSLKKLRMHGTCLLWEDMTMIGSLPHLEVLKLESHSFVGSEWNPVEGEFPSLKFLEVAMSQDLLYWGADSSHFPSLTHLVLRSNRLLKEIPMEIGEIPTLRSIKVYLCLDSVVISAKNILEEQLSYGNEDIQVEVLIRARVHRKLDISTSKNFLVRIGDIPDFAEVYSFIGSIFDSDSKDHVHKLKEMDPIDCETVLLLMKNLSVNLSSPDF